MVANISDSFSSVWIRFSLAWMPTTQFLVKEREPGKWKVSVRRRLISYQGDLPSASRRMLCNTFFMMTGLNTFN